VKERGADVELPGYCVTAGHSCLEGGPAFFANTAGRCNCRSCEYDAEGRHRYRYSGANLHSTASSVPDKARVNNGVHSVTLSYGGSPYRYKDFHHGPWHSLAAALHKHGTLRNQGHGICKQAMLKGISTIPGICCRGYLHMSTCP